MKERKTIVIIGAGVAGLSAGIYAEQHGFNAIILEKNPNVGGLCTGWMRRGFEIDGCIHWLTGTNPKDCLFDMWRNVDAFSSVEDIHDPESWGSFEVDGKRVTFWADTKRAEKEWIEVAPEDEKQIKKFFKMVRDIASVSLPLQAPISMLPFKTCLKLVGSVIKVLPNFLYPMTVSCEKYSKKFKNPIMRYVIRQIQPGGGNLYSMIFSYATIVNHDGGVPYGGAKYMTLRMADRFTSLGGVLKTSTPVKHILTKNNKAVGVKLEDGSKIYGDYVISCVDAGYTVNKLLLGQYKSGFDKRFREPNKYQTPSCCFVSLVIEDLPEFVSPLNFPTETFRVGASDIDTINLRSYSFDKTFAKGNKEVCTVLIDQYADDYNVWSELYKQDKALYNAKKKELGELVKTKIIEKFPSLENKITVIDVVSPRTYKNYCNNTKGAYMSFLFNEKTGMYVTDGRIKGLKNFYIGSQWIQAPGGLPLALASGKFTIQRICKKENIKFLLDSKLYKSKKVINKI